MLAILETPGYLYGMSDSLRDILNRVASGELSPEDAQAELAAVPSGVPAPPTADPQPEPAAEQVAVAKVVVRATGVRLTILGDATVDTAIAEGPHKVHQDGDRLVISSDLSQPGGYTGEAPRSAFMNWISTMNKAGSNLRVRVNPNLALEVLNIAGSLDLSGTAGPAAIGVEAGSARLNHGSGPLALSVASGSADVEWVFAGESSVSCELGSARVTVLPGSDVSVTVDATLGSAAIRSTAGTQKTSAAGGPLSATVGQGAGRLAVSAKLGSAEVRL
jgi:hypothetical protein